MTNRKHKMTLTEQKVAEMLRENTGRHFLDSGGAYGRNWERNQRRTFVDEPSATLNGRWGLEFTINLFHFLTDKLSYDPTMQRRFSNFARREDQQEECWLSVMENFVEHLKEKAEAEGRSIGGIYGDGDPVTVNSYNEDNTLSQTIQFIYWEDDDGDHVLLQVHGGCDVRGGYTAPKAFTCNSELSIFDYRRGGIYCTGDNVNTVQTEIPGTEVEPCNAAWTTDDAYHWYDQNGNWQDDRLDRMEMVEESKEDEDDEVRGWRKGILYVKEDGTILCPHCGSTLAGSLY